VDERLDRRAGTDRQWHDRALERSLAERRDRSLRKLFAIVAAARGLAETTGTAAFTMQQVAEAAGVSLKTIYRYFPGKDDLLLALLEQDCRRGATLLEIELGEHGEPAERLEAYVRGIFALLAAGDVAYVAMLVREYLRLSETRHDALRLAVAPLVDPLAAEIAEASRRGAARSREPERDAQTVFDLVLVKIGDVVLGPEPLDARGVDELGRYLWNFVAGALGVGDPDLPPVLPTGDPS
jgi:AcrR family transcriptional regulator